MARNIELLTKVRDLVVEAPDRLEMGTWASFPESVMEDHEEQVRVDCGSTACIAGWAVQLHGYKFLVKSWMQNLDGLYDTSVCVAANGRVMDIQEKAQQLLGLTESEADFLFLETENGNAVEVLNRFIEGKCLGEIREETYPATYVEDDVVPF